MYKSILLPVAKAQIIDALKWYKVINENLKKEFKLVLIETIKELENSPEHFQIRYADIRLKRVGKWPYLIHYRGYKNRKIIVLSAVFHEKENAKKWNK